MKSNNKIKGAKMRSRNIRNSFFKSDQLAGLNSDDKLLFIGLWCLADREGFFEIRPVKMKLEIFPDNNKITPDKIMASLHRLMSRHVITFKDTYGFIPKFVLHQRPHPHEAKSTVLDEFKKTLINQCHDMSLHVTQCTSDVLNPDILNPLKEKTEDCKPKEYYFSLFWELSPSKIGKIAAEQEFYRQHGHNGNFEAIMAGMSRQIAEKKKEKEIYGWTAAWPNARRWLREQRWKDEPREIEEKVKTVVPSVDINKCKQFVYSDERNKVFCNIDDNLCEWKYSGYCRKYEINHPPRLKNSNLTTVTEVAHNLACAKRLI
jgi:hypothetical protein